MQYPIPYPYDTAYYELLHGIHALAYLRLLRVPHSAGYPGPGPGLSIAGPGACCGLEKHTMLSQRARARNELRLFVHS